tara:strand:- start:1113 stop:2438 length:1326 start_codon:yes stop_codon:yes gene_type:complete
MATINFELLYRAGKALVEPENKHAIKPFTEMVKMGKKYFDDAKLKMENLAASSPTIDISKVSSENTPMVVNFLREQKFIIGDAARRMALNGSTSEQGVIATDEYNSATQRIVTFNNDLIKFQSDRKFAIENQYMIGDHGTQPAKNDMMDLANGTMYSKLFEENGRLMYTDYEGNKKPWADYKQAPTNDDSLGEWFVQLSTQNYNNAIAGHPFRDFDTKHAISSKLKSSTSDQIRAFIYGGLPGDSTGMNYIQKYMTDSVEEGGLGLPMESADEQAELDMFFEALKKDEDLVNHFAGHLYDVLQTDHSNNYIPKSGSNSQNDMGIKTRVMKAKARKVEKVYNKFKEDYWLTTDNPEAKKGDRTTPSGEDWIEWLVMNIDSNLQGVLKWSPKGHEGYYAIYQATGDGDGGAQWVKIQKGEDMRWETVQKFVDWNRVILREGDY